MKRYTNALQKYLEQQRAIDALLELGTKEQPTGTS